MFEAHSTPIRMYAHPLTYWTRITIYTKEYFFLYSIRAFMSLSAASMCHDTPDVPKPIAQHHHNITKLDNSPIPGASVDYVTLTLATARASSHGESSTKHNTPPAPSGHCAIKIQTRKGREKKQPINIIGFLDLVLVV